ncbi:MAG: hypothetical protein RIS16_377 [Actinomycetota bacterium]|jgi:uncharacterized protein YndB with AHSA1/START domain
MTQAFLYSVEREYPVSISDLWSAWTDPVKLETWYFPTALKSVRGATKSELTLGGLWACGVDVAEFGFVAYFYGKYTKIEQEKQIEHTLHYTQSKEEFEAKDFETESHLIVLDFEDRGESSWVKFSQYGELPEGQAAQAQAGMESYLDSLSNFFTK